VSHEIRTPMHQQLGMATLLAQTPLSKEQSEYVATVQASGEHLLTVLNDILDYSKQESGSLELELQIIDLVATVEQAVELSFRSKEDKQLELIMDIQHGEEACAGLSNLPPSPAPAPPALPQMVVGDVTRLRQVVVNIISNACKFSTKAGGSVRISIGCANRLAASVGAAAHEPLSYQALEALVRNGDISRDYWQRLHGVTPQTAAAAEAAAAAAAHHHRRQSSQPDQQHPPAQAPSVPEYDLFPVAAPGSELAATRFLEVQVSVADSGIGIPRSKLHRLFKAFSQLDVSTTREYGGTGLGLAISAKLVQLMGGQMWCESEEGHGATFSFTFITPVVPQAVAASASATPRVPAGAATPAASSPARDESGPLVCRRLQLLASSPKLVLLVSQSTAWVANLERQLRRWGLDVRVFPTSLEAATWFQQQDASKMLQQLAAVLQDYTPKPRPPVPSSAGGGLSRFGSAVAGYVSSSGQPVPLTGDGTRPSLSSLHTQARPPSSSSLQRPASSGNAAGGSVQQPAAASTPAGTGAAVSATSSSSQQQDGAQSSVHHLAQAVRMAETKANASSSAAVFYACNGSVQVEETLAVEDLAVKWVRKPLLLSKLRSLLQSCVLQKKRSPAAPPSVAPTRRLAEALPVSILVVEDNRVNMKLALVHIHAQHERLRWVDHGWQANG
jgi:signal transduction histidine kinase